MIFMPGSSNWVKRHFDGFHIDWIISDPLVQCKVDVNFVKFYQANIFTFPVDVGTKKIS